MDSGAAMQGAPVEAGTPDQPVRGADRLVSLDFIRGIAVLGILFANITAFGQPYMAYFWPEALAEPATRGRAGAAAGFSSAGSAGSWASASFTIS